jgi:hypothetical protein
MARAVADNNDTYDPESRARAIEAIRKSLKRRRKKNDGK